MFDTTTRFAPAKLSVPHTPEKKTSVDQDKGKPKQGHWQLPASAQPVKRAIFELLVFILFLVVTIAGIVLCFAALMALT